MAYDPKELKLVGVDFSEPFDMKTFSGSSYHIWSKLKEKRVLVDSFSPYPPANIVRFFKLLSFNPDIQRWKANWHASVIFRKYISSRARKRIMLFARSSINASLQIGAYYNISSCIVGPKGLIADNNCVIAQNTNINFKSSGNWFRRLYDWEKQVYRSVDQIFCFSKFLANSFINDFGLPESKVSVIYAGINLDENKITVPNKSYNSKTVLFSGFDFKNKGGEVLLRAFDIVTKAVPGARLILTGPNINNLPDYVTNLGPLSKTNPQDLEKLYNSYKEASIFTLPTLADAFPNVIREAMAAKLPCVASDTGSMSEMIVDGKTGYIIPIGDADALANRLISLLTDENLCKIMGTAGYERQKQLFSWDAVCERIISKMSVK